MKLFLVLDERHFYQPDFVARFLEKTSDEIVGASLITKVPTRNDIGYYFMKHWFYLNVFEIAKLVGQSLSARLFDVFSSKASGGKFYSVRSVLKSFQIDFIDIQYDINQKKYVDYMKSRKPDVIISSNSLYFTKEILNIPTICCINRHSALLPAYGGALPVFHAYLNGEERTGVSVHLMNEKYDDGNVLAQKEIEIKTGDTIAYLYEKTFECSADVVLESLEKIRKNDFSPVRNKQSPSYRSFPTRVDWERFRKRNGKFI